GFLKAQPVYFQILASVSPASARCHSSKTSSLEARSATTIADTRTTSSLKRLLPDTVATSRAASSSRSGRPERDSGGRCAEARVRQSRGVMFAGLGGRRSRTEGSAALRWAQYLFQQCPAVPDSSICGSWLPSDLTSDCAARGRVPRQVMATDVAE